MKNKNTSSVIDAMKIIIKKFKPQIVQSDLGSEFTSKLYKDLMKENNIDIRYVDVGEHHELGIIDRFCKTLRSLIDKYITAYNTTTYIDVLDKIVNNYNNTYHRTLKCSPNEASKHQDDINLINLKKYKIATENEVKYDIDDKVRCVVNKKMFTKGSLPHYSKTIYKIIDKSNHSYKLNNSKWYKYYELLKVDSVEHLNEDIQKQTREQLKKDKRIKEKLNRENMNIKNIITTKRSNTKAIKDIDKALTNMRLSFEKNI
jgi:molybdopterin converting factor small subunit